MSVSLLKTFKKIHASTKEIDAMLASILKIRMNESGREAATFGRDNLAGLQPNEEGFIAYICEQENYRGKFNICRDPVQFTGIDRVNPKEWKLTFCRKVCDRIRKTGVCRRALIKVEYLD